MLSIFIIKSIFHSWLKNGKIILSKGRSESWWKFSIKLRKRQNMFNPLILKEEFWIQFLKYIYFEENLNPTLTLNLPDPNMYQIEISYKSKSFILFFPFVFLRYQLLFNQRVVRILKMQVTRDACTINMNFSFLGIIEDV